MRIKIILFWVTTCVLAMSMAGVSGAAAKKKAGGKCARDIDCKGELVCDNHICTDLKKQKGKRNVGCVKDTECKGNRVCIDGACQDPTPPPPEPVSCPEECAKDTDCKGSRVCREGQCKEPPPPAKKKATPKKLRDDEVQQPGTALFWLRCPLGQHWNGKRCRGRASRDVRWDTATEACPAGYRLPTREEFVRLLGTCRPGVKEGGRGYCSPCQRSGNCLSMFGRDRLMYWSSTSYALDPRNAWRAAFADGGVGADSKRAGRAVRCVRNSK